MNNLWLIIRREFSVRVRSKWFVVGTLVGPVIMLALLVIPALLATMGGESKLRVFVVDPSGQLFDQLPSKPELAFSPFIGSVETLKDSVRANPDFAGLVLPRKLSKSGDLSATFLAQETPTPTQKAAMERVLTRVLRERRMQEAGIAQADLDFLQAEFQVTSRKVTEAGESQTSTVLGLAVGYFVAFLIYLMIILYGNQVMRGVLEEKTNRIVEVMASTVRPIHLMLGKVVAIGMVGMVQQLIWGFLIIVFSLTLLPALMPAAEAGSLAGPEQAAAISDAEQLQLEFQQAFSQFDFSVLWYVALFFIGGFLLYGALFAALAAAADQEADLQSVTIVVYLPLIVAFIAINGVINAPNGELALWTSYLPITSPVIMPVRMVLTQMPWWSVGLSWVILAGSVIGFTWLAGRIYRTAILLHGQKLTFKRLGLYLLQGGR